MEGSSKGGCLSVSACLALLMPLPTHPKGLMARATVGFGRPAEPANAPTPLERPVPAGRGIAVFSLQSRAFCALLFLSFFFSNRKIRSGVRRIFAKSPALWLFGGSPAFSSLIFLPFSAGRWSLQLAAAPLLLACLFSAGPGAFSSALRQLPLPPLGFPLFSRALEPAAQLPLPSYGVAFLQPGLEPSAVPCASCRSRL